MNEQEIEDPCLVYTLDLSARNLKTVPSKLLTTYKNCKSLDLSCNSIQSVKKDNFLEITQLKELKLYSNQIDHLNGFQTLLKLEQLQLQFNNIVALGSSFKLNKSLKLLRLDSNKLTCIKTDEICSLSNLTYIDISSNRLQSISSLNVLNSLEELHCTHNLLSKVQDLRSLKKLRDVELSNNVLTDLSGLKGLCRLSCLSIECNRISTLSSLGVMKSLQELKLSQNHVKDLKHISEQFQNLEILDVSCNRIISVEQYSYLSKLSSLKELTLHDNPASNTTESKKNIVETSNNLNLDILDHVFVKKSASKDRLPSAMRPMSANRMISSRFIEDQMIFLEMSLTDHKDKLNSQFSAVHGLLSNLPAEKPASSLSSTKESCRSVSSSNISGRPSSQFSVKRPSSRCSSRTRLEDAKAFAAANF